jgi:hypothetical protein
MLLNLCVNVVYDIQQSLLIAAVTHKSEISVAQCVA